MQIYQTFHKFILIIFGNGERFMADIKKNYRTKHIYGICLQIKSQNIMFFTTIKLD